MAWESVLSPRWRKVVADVWENRARTLLVVVSIAVGVFAVGMIAGTYVIMPRDMNASYAARNPANIEMVTDGVDDAWVRAIGRMEGVSEAEGRRTLVVRLRTGPEAWTTLDLVAADDPGQARVSQLLLLQGTSSPGDREVVLLDKTIERWGLAVGEMLEVELLDGTARQLRIVGVVKDLTSGPEGITGNGAGYINLDALEWLHQPDSYDRILITVAERADDGAHIRNVAEAIQDRLEEGGHPVHRTEIHLRHRHPLSSIIQAVLGVLGLLGVLLVFLSGSLIANTLSALLSQHLRYIGVIKLVGGRRSQVVGMYATLILTFGLLALLPALPLAGWAAYALAGRVAKLVNFVLREPPVVPLIPQAAALQVAIALLIPMLAGILPVIKGSRVTVREAIGSAGLGDGQTGRGWLQAGLVGLREVSRGFFRGLSRPLIISLRNTFRRKGRLALTLFTLILGGAIFVAVFNVRVSLGATVRGTSRYFQGDVNIDLVQSYRVEQVTRDVLAMPGVERVEAWTSARAELVGVRAVTDVESTPSEGGTSVTVLAPPSDTTLVEPALLSGRWLAPGDEGAIAINDAFGARYPALRPGDTLRLKIAGDEADWTVVGVFRYTGSESLYAYTHYEDLARTLHQPNRAALYRVVASEHTVAYQQNLARRLDRALQDLGYDVAQVEAGAALTGRITELLDILVVVLLVMALLTALVGSIGLTGTLSMNVLERTREIGVMRAIGAHDRIVVRLVIVEGLLIGLLSYAVGVLLSLPISVLLANIISLAIFHAPATLALTAQGSLIWLLVVLALSVVASLLPARNASRLTIREVLAYE